MLKKMIFSAIVLLLVSCEREGILTKNGINDSTISNTATLTYSGTFIPTSGISVTGAVKIYRENNLKKAVLENFSISNGPDLKIYLSKSGGPTDFVNLGSLSSAGVYLIPQQVDVTQYKYVLIHCQQYNHLFAFAPLN